MSATCLVYGKLQRGPLSKTSSRGTAYATATVREGQGDDVRWWTLFAFNDQPRAELLSLHAGDSVAVSGPFKAEIYTKDGEPRVSLSLTADRLLSAKRQKRERAVDSQAARKAEGRADNTGRPFDDQVPF